MSDIKTGVELIAAERQRQIEVEGWTVEHDAEHKEGEISMAAGSYLAHSLSRYREERHHTNQSPLADFKVYDFGESNAFVNGPIGDRGDRRLRPSGWRNSWPWDFKWWKPSDDPVKDLIKAGALIAAEIDRLQSITPQITDHGE